MVTRKSLILPQKTRHDLLALAKCVSERFDRFVLLVSCLIYLSICFVHGACALSGWNHFQHSSLV